MKKHQTWVTSFVRDARAIDCGPDNLALYYVKQTFFQDPLKNEEAP